MKRKNVTGYKYIIHLYCLALPCGLVALHGKQEALSSRFKQAMRSLPRRHLVARMIFISMFYCSDHVR